MSRALTIGTFDGVHLGHATLVQRCRELVGSAGTVIALAFDPHPLTSLRPEMAPPRLTTFEQRRDLLLKAGADRVQHLRPDDRTLSLSPEEFVECFVTHHEPAYVVEGADFRFGRKRAGDLALLEQLGRGHGFETVCVPPVEVSLTDHTLVRASSSLARWLLHHGRIADLRRVLGHVYVVEGEVQRGRQRGRTIGFPTANLHPRQTLPAPGVYAGQAVTPGGARHLAAINVGANPTFGETYRHAEVHLIDAGDLENGYGWELTVEFHAFVRDLIRFSGPEALVRQIERDVEHARAAMSGNAAGGPGHIVIRQPDCEPARSDG
jgi:riboflavin kinase/FMN adenylyltransferase